MSWFVYIIKAKSGKYYTGITIDLERRFNEHFSKKGAKFFRHSEPESIVYSEVKMNRSEATKREIEIKRMTRSKKIALIQQKLLNS